MLMDFENYYEKFDLYEKCKYKLYVNHALSYSFVTTSRPENECIEILKNKAKAKNSFCRIHYKITKVKKKEEVVLKKGFFDP